MTGKWEQNRNMDYKWGLYEKRHKDYIGRSGVKKSQKLLVGKFVKKSAAVKALRIMRAYFHHEADYTISELKKEHHEQTA